jgi:hypothetical protein
MAKYEQCYKVRDVRSQNQEVADPGRFACAADTEGNLSGVLRPA